MRQQFCNRSACVNNSADFLPQANLFGAQFDAPLASDKPCYQPPNSQSHPRRPTPAGARACRDIPSENNLPTFALRRRSATTAQDSRARNHQRNTGSDFASSSVVIRSSTQRTFKSDIWSKRSPMEADPYKISETRRSPNAVFKRPVKSVSNVSACSCVLPVTACSPTAGISTAKTAESAATAGISAAETAAPAPAHRRLARRYSAGCSKSFQSKSRCRCHEPPPPRRFKKNQQKHDEK